MIYLHVGLPKVASTTIQTFLAHNRSALAKRGYVYPELSPKRRHLGVGSISHNSLAVELRRGSTGQTWQRLREIQTGLASGEQVILSGEAFAGCKPSDVRRALGTDTVVIICYIRNFADIVVSQYSHGTKIGVRTDDFDGYFEKALRKVHFDLPKLFTGWADPFGKENIRVRMLDPRAMFRQDVRLDVLETVGIDADQSDVSDFDLVKSANEGLGWKTVEILRALHGSLMRHQAEKDGPESLDDERRLRQRRQGSPLLDFTSALSGIAEGIGREMGFSEKGRYLTQAQFDRCNRLFNDQVDQVAAQGFDVRAAHAREDGFVPRTFLPSVKEIPKDEVAAFLLKIFPVFCWDLLVGEAK